jgi:ribosomal protein S18 acetylase RimI-like enzyme
VTANVEALRESNLEEVLEILARSPLENITLIADCTQLRDWCDIKILRDRGTIRAIFSLYSDLDFVATAFWSENSGHLDRIIQEFADELPEAGFVAICTEGQLAQLQSVCSSVEPTREMQMYADSATELKCQCKSKPVKMKLEDAEDLRELYRICGTPAWTPSALNLGPFYGIKAEEGSIVSVAGVHYVTPHGAEIGNVATHPSHRRKGYAEACIKAVSEDVLRESDRVLLHYFADNQAARKLYENMGFRYSSVDPLFFVRARL